MPTLLVERRLKRREQIQLFISRNCARSFEPTDEYPGSPAKIEILRKRFAKARKQHLTISLFHRDDGQLPIGKGWRFTVEGNGSVPTANKILVDEDQANAREIARQDTLSVLEEVRRIFATESFPCPPARVC